MKKVKATSFSDCQHGWLAVKRDIVDQVMGLENVTRHSFQRGKTVYLECDEDVSRFMKAIEDKGIELEIKNGKYYEVSPIRYYNLFYHYEAEAETV